MTAVGYSLRLPQNVPHFPLVFDMYMACPRLARVFGQMYSLFCSRLFCSVILHILRVATNPENLEYSEISLNTENSGNSVQPQRKIVTKSIFSSSFKYLCKTAVDWVNRFIRNRDEVRVRWWPVILLELMWNDPWWRSLLEQPHTLVCGCSYVLPLWFFIFFISASLISAVSPPIWLKFGMLTGNWCNLWSPVPNWG